MTFGDMFAPVDQNEVRKRLAGIGLPGAPEYNAPIQPALKPTIAAPAPSTPALNVPSVSQVNPQQQADEAEFNRLKSSKPGVSQVKNPVLRTLGRIADVAGTVMFPTVAAAIPGTTLHHNELENEAANRVANDLAQNQKEAATAETSARTNALANPVLTPEQQYLKEATSQGKSVAEGVQGYTDATNKTQDKGINNAQEGYAQAIAAAIQAGRDPSTDPHVLAWKQAVESLQKTPVETSAMADNQYQNILVKENMGQKLTPEEQATKKAYEHRKTLGQTTTFNLNQPGKDQKMDSQLRATVAKEYEPSLDSAERFNVMAESAEKALKDHDQQAMLNLLANHLGMTMGLQKGARLNQTVIDEAQKAQPWLEGMKAKFDKNGYLSGVVLSPMQIRQMVQLGQSRFSEDTVKARNASKYLGATDDGPERTPNKSTMRYYLDMAGGDVSKAKQLAADDGWTVK